MAGAGHLPQPVTKAQDKSAIVYLCNDFALDTVVATGPLTNLAMALQRKPSLSNQIENLIIMGGCVRPDPVFNLMGNLTVKGTQEGKAEYNFAVDPQAARHVFQSGIKNIAMIGLDVTHQAIVTPERLDEVRAIDTSVGCAAAGLLDHYHRVDLERHGVPGSPLHDPCVIAYLLRPELFSGRRAFVGVETQSEATMGRTVVDFWNATGRKANATVIESIDADGFFDLLIERLSQL